MYRFKTQETLTEHVKDYWNARSTTYSLQNIEEMECFKRDAWRSLILSQAPKKEKLRILDVGTGPGFFAINLALAGHDVTAVDMTSGMLEEASRNADAYGAELNFFQSDAQSLPFEDESFDLVISRNVVWNLEKPETALEEWKRVLCKGGRILYFDANWYLYLYDDNLREKYEWSQRTALQRVPGTTTGNKMEDLARTLPLSKLRRPEWDREALERIDMQLVCIDESIGSKVWDDDEKIRYAYAPIFMVAAEK